MFLGNISKSNMIVRIRNLSSNKNQNLIKINWDMVYDRQLKLFKIYLAK